MSDPNCTIVLSFFKNLPSSRFWYNCISSSSGWMVHPDGTFVPPSQSRIVQIRLGHPSGIGFSGFQIVSDPDHFPAPGEKPWHIEDGLQMTVLEPTPFPPPAGTVVEALTLDFTDSGPLLYYRLAVDDVWDDPKIYNDPAE